MSGLCLNFRNSSLKHAHTHGVLMSKYSVGFFFLFLAKCFSSKYVFQSILKTKPKYIALKSRILPLLTVTRQ